MTAKTTKKRNKRFKRGEKRCFTPRYFTYGESQRGKSKNLRFLAGVMGDSVPNRPHPAKKKFCMPRQEYSHACPVFIRTPPRGKSKNLRFLAGVIGDIVPNRPHQARENFAPRQKYSHAYPAFIRTPQRGKSKNLRFLAGVIGDSVPYRSPLHPSAEPERKPA